MFVFVFVFVFVHVFLYIVQETYRKIMNFSETLSFPKSFVLSNDSKSLIRSLLCEPQNRLVIEEIKSHSFFCDVDWKTIRKGPSVYVPSVASITGSVDYPRLPSSSSSMNQKSNTTKVSSSSSSPYDLPFIGYTYKSFDAVRPRANLLQIPQSLRRKPTKRRSNPK